MDIALDSEFLENGITIRPISIALVREDGKEYYGINQNRNILLVAARDKWLYDNVLSSLPLVQPVDPFFPVWDKAHPDFAHVKDTTRIALDVASFIQDTPNPSLWAFYAAYDHVLLAQLFGKMINLPAGIPMRTNDIAQEAERLGNVRMPPMHDASQHNALSDAREVMFRLKWLREYERGLL